MANFLAEKETHRRKRTHNAYRSVGKQGYYSPTELVEIQRCAQDPVYFAKHYAKILHPVRGRIPFHVWEFQEQTLREFLSNPFNICLKPRQMGLSWLVALFITWVMIFFPDKNILVVSIKLGAAVRFLDKIKYIIMNLPDFLQPQITEASRMILQLDNGSRVESIPTSEEAGRSEGVSLMVFDEAAFIRWMDKIWSAAFPTLSTGGMCIALSTANGVGNWFHKKWQDAISGVSGFNAIKLNWKMHPERDKSWYNQMKAELGDLRFAQEVLCDFLTSGNPFFNPSVLRGIEESDLIAPTIHDISVVVGSRIGKVSVPVRVFHDPRPGSFYAIPVDPCKGDGTSRLGLHVLEIAGNHIRQVAACSEKIPADLTAHVAAELGYMYNTACIGVENNKGMVTLKILHDDLLYPDIYTMEKLLRKDGEIQRQGELGFNMNTKTRPHVLGQLEVATRNETMLIHDVETLNQMWNFCYSEGTFRPEARPGYCDDLVLSGAIGYEMGIQFGFGTTRRNSVIRSGAPVFGNDSVSMGNFMPETETTDTLPLDLTKSDRELLDRLGVRA